MENKDVCSTGEDEAQANPDQHHKVLDGHIKFDRDSNGISEATVFTGKLSFEVLDVQTVGIIYCQSSQLDVFLHFCLEVSVALLCLLM